MITALIHYKISIFLTVVITGFLSLYVLATAYKRRIMRLYGLYTLAIFLWSLLWLAIINSADPERNLFFCRLLHFPAIFIPCLFIYFVQTLLDIDRNRVQRRIRWVVVLVGIALLPFVFSPAFVPRVEPRSEIPYFGTMGPVYPLFTAIFFIEVLYAFSLLAHAWRKSLGDKRIQLTHIFCAYAFGYTAAIGVFSPVFRINMPSVSIYPIPLAHIWILYAILRHRFLAVRIVVRRTALLLFIYGALLVALVPALIYVQRTILFGRSSFLLPLTIEAVLCGMVFSVGPFLYAYLIRRNAFFHEHTIAGLTHELKTPLAAIESVADLLSGTRTASTHDVRSYAEMIDRNAQRLRASVEKLTQAFGGSIKSRTLAMERVDLAHLLRRSVATVQWIAEGKGISLQLFSAKNPVLVDLDTSKFEQIVANLVSNAIKFTESGTVTVQLDVAEEEARISVSDPGAGLEAEEIPKIFDRFYQTEIGRRKKGTGLGLTIAKTWVEAHGGRIWAESEGLGKGTTVTFTVPVT